MEDNVNNENSPDLNPPLNDENNFDGVVLMNMDFMEQMVENDEIIISVNADGEDGEDDDDDDEELMEHDNYYLNGFLREEVNLTDENTNEESNVIRRTFDTNLPTEHSYLGNDLEYLRGRVLFEDYQIIRLQILPGDTIVCPGYTLPLTYFHHRALIHNIITKDRTFGLTYALADRHDYTLIGVTMEIYEFAETPHEIKLKAKGRQRFRVLDTDDQMPVGLFKVQILPEIELPPPLQNIQIESLNKCRVHISDKDTFKRNQLYRRRDAAQTRWPLWVFNSYDENYLVTEITEILKNFKEILPKDPLQLSYWVVQNFLLSTTERIEALNLDCATQRLRLVLSYMRKRRCISCAQCQEEFAGQEDLFPMSKDGVQNNFVNPGGVVHETITVLKAHRISLVGQPQTEYSWFPGYAWTIAQCRLCNHHIGWRFTAVKPDLQPHKFFGLTRSSVVIKTTQTK